MTDDMVELRALNPAPADAEAHEAEWSDAALLAEIDTRSGTDMSLDQKPKTERANAVEGTRRWNRGLVAAAAFAAVIGVIGIVALVRDGGGPVPETTVPPANTATSSPPQTTTSAPSTTAIPSGAVPTEVEQLLNQYVSVYNAGDVDAFRTLHAPGILREAQSDDFEWTSDLDEQSEIYEFFIDIAQSIELTDCEQSAATGITWCKAIRRDALTRAADIEDFTLLGLRFQEGLIVEWRESFVGANTYLSAIEAFGNWMAEAHPEQPALTTDNDFLYAADGEVALQFLQEWQSINQGVDPADWQLVADLVSAVNSGDVDGYMALFAAEPSIQVVSSSGPGWLTVEQARDEVIWRAGVGTKLTGVTCVPVDFELRCGAVLTDAILDAATASSPMNFRLTLTDDGLISHYERTSFFYWANLGDVLDTFLEWIRVTYPADEDVIFFNGDPTFTAESAAQVMLRIEEFRQFIGR